MIRKIVRIWKIITEDSGAKLREELIAALKRNVELEKAIAARPVELVQMPTEDTMPAYLKTLAKTWENPHFRAFMVMRERELLGKFKSGGDAEILRGALVCIDDIAAALDDATSKARQIGAANE